MPKLIPITYSNHVERWKGCQLCDLCETRKSVVLLRGTVPAKVLFVGEAPGPSEDVLGRPFVGPAGKLFDRIVRLAGIKAGDFAMTNLICCLPLDEEGEKFTTPPMYAINACASRLRECVKLVQPNLLVWVGSEAKKYGPKIITIDQVFNAIDIIHPAAILRMHVSQQTLAFQRVVVALKDAWELVQ